MIPRINISHQLESVSITLGEVLTVWMDGNQVELRVLPNGKRQIFYDDSEMQAQKFIMWVSIEQEMTWDRDNDETE